MLVVSVVFVYLFNAHVNADVNAHAFAFVCKVCCSRNVRSSIEKKEREATNTMHAL